MNSGWAQFCLTVAARGDHPALLMGDLCLSFRDLGRMARRHAAGLARQGAGPGDRVILRLPNGPAALALDTWNALLALAGEAAPTLAGVSKWADDVRDAGLGDRRTAKWHFVNFKGGDCTYVPPRDCPDGNCVIAAINRNFLALADRKRATHASRMAL